VVRLIFGLSSEELIPNLAVHPSEGTGVSFPEAQGSARDPSLRLKNGYARADTGKNETVANRQKTSDQNIR
jgi:hypothetical protein